MADGKLTGNLSGLSGGLNATSLSGEMSLATQSTGPGETNYESLTNKPKINGYELVGNKPLDSFFFVGHGLQYDRDTCKLSVKMAEEVEVDNTLPISSASVYTAVGNIQELLKTI